MQETPLRLEGISDTLYGGFGERLGSLLLDSLIIMPIAFLTLYLNSMDKNLFFYTLIPNLVFQIGYHIYLPIRYGATPGKLVMGIQILKIDGQEIGWKEAFMRHLVILLLTVFSSALMIYCLLSADDATYQGLSWMKQSQYLMTFAPVLFLVYTWVANIWTWGELIVLLTNPRKRALHDYMAGTVIVKKVYVKRIQDKMAGL